ncbi:MAG: (2Fe-2S)-binding protein, partial [Proteobacteria bacterium]|nr:(2Fe-2S)-binding protein [Pseudomonadota bacterium]
PALLARPDLLARGAGWLTRLRRAGVPVLSGHAVAAIAGTDAVEGARVVRLGPGGAPLPGAPVRNIACDTVCYGFGLLPSTEATRLLGAAHDFVPSLGGWTPRLDADGRSSVPLLYAAGDGAGVLGADAAPLRGRLAALAALRDLDRIDPAEFDRTAAPLRRTIARAGGFGRAMTALSLPPPGLAALIEPGTPVCRCEGITRAALDAAIAAGAVAMNDLKAATRCGMGPCGGRVCGEPAALLLAAATGRPRAAIAEATARPPLRPMPIAALAGACDYDDLPIPAPAPL